MYNSPMGARAKAKAAAITVRRRAKLLIGDHRVLLPLYLRLTPEGTARAITARTDLVVEGFPRSGTTFAAHALRLAQSEPIVITNHVHNLSILDVAISRSVPTLVVVREPVDCLASYLVWEPAAPASTVLWEWLHYHSRLVRRAHRLTVVGFEEVRTSLPDIVSRLNHRYGSAFDAPPTTESFRSDVELEVRRRHAQVHPNQVQSRGVPVPDAGRDEAAALARERLGAPRHAAEVDRARALYEELTRSR
ncbi:MAG: hypothetical protein OEU32_14375 [Acidimicrobiia bacterium]|nr:hypothetical protein [Acidimicrobiia bacterium]